MSHGSERIALRHGAVGLECVAPGGAALPIPYIVGIGRNYAEHAKEMQKGGVAGAEVPDRPMVFTKSPMSAILTGDPIVIPRICQDRDQVDFEGELAVIIGRAARDVSERDAADPASGIILGYAIANDVSARWWQKQGSGGQFCRGKSFDTFCPLGPWITPASRIAAIGGPQALRKLGPGMLNEVEFIRQVRTHCPDLTLFDSGAVADSFISRLWPGRRPMGSLVLPTRPLAALCVNGVERLRQARRRPRADIAMDVTQKET